MLAAEWRIGDALKRWAAAHGAIDRPNDPAAGPTPLCPSDEGDATSPRGRNSI